MAAASRFQASPLVHAPSYPNAIAWSDENSIAVAAGDIVTILNPALPLGPRGVISFGESIPITKTHPIGRINKQELLSGVMLPTALYKDETPCIRSISWSPIGMAPNYGCLLAVCTREGHVKIYRPPFCDFRAQWVEVADISIMLYDYFVKTNFLESEVPPPELVHELSTFQGCAGVLPDSVAVRESKRRRRVKATITINKDSETFGNQLADSTYGENPLDGKILSKVYRSKSKHLEKDELEIPLITANQYASRIGMLSSTVVAWSPALSSSEMHSGPHKYSYNRFSILAVGGKSGKISFWRIHEPECYTIEHNRVPTAVTFVGFLWAHNSWITSISIALFGSNPTSKVILASGSSDGSVKIWLANREQLLESSKANNAPFLLLTEVVSVNNAQVSVLSLILPAQSPQKVLLAIGKGSGSFEVWTYDISGRKLDKVGAYDAHDYVVTGLAWSFDGHCLYSSGQDNYVRGWALHGSSLHEVPLPTNTVGVTSSSDLPHVFLSCTGLATSPGNLVLAMVRNLDVKELHHMYEARTYRAIVEFFWIGGQVLDTSNTSPEFVNEASPGFPPNELVSWKSNILQSLTSFSILDKPLVVWDILAALSAFKQSIPKYMDHVLVTWLSKAHLGSTMELPMEEVLTSIPQSISKISSRHLQVLNIICRRVILSEFKADEINCKLKNNQNGAEEKPLTLWVDLLSVSERELRERLVGFSFAAFIGYKSYLATIHMQPGHWYPIGVAQMEQWVNLNTDHVRDELKVLIPEVQKQRRLQSTECSAEEQCGYCSSPVPLESSDFAFCKGLESTNRDVEKHKLTRCAASMQVCPVTTPLWFCKCCHRWASTLAPDTLFTMAGYPSDFRSLIRSSGLELSKPLCPFCGVVLQRQLPDFLPSVSPV